MTEEVGLHILVVWVVAHAPDSEEVPGSPAEVGEVVAQEVAPVVEEPGILGEHHPLEVEGEHHIGVVAGTHAAVGGTGSHAADSDWGCTPGVLALAPLHQE